MFIDVVEPKVKVVMPIDEHDDHPEAMNYPDEPIRTTTSVVITIRQLYIHLYIERLSDAQIARKYELSPKTIRNFRRKCNFDATFKTGTMDLPLSQVRGLLAEGKTYDNIASELNTTKTAVKVFCDRHTLSSKNPSWPISRQQAVDLMVLETTAEDVSRRYNVSVEEVQSVYVGYGLSPFVGQKTFINLGNTPRKAPPERSYNGYVPEDWLDVAHIVFGYRFREHPKLGFLLDNNPINTIDLCIKLSPYMGTKINRG